MHILVSRSGNEKCELTYSQSRLNLPAFLCHKYTAQGTQSQFDGRRPMRMDHPEKNTKRLVVPFFAALSIYIYLHPQDCEDLLSITPPQSVKIQQYIRHLETEGIARVKMYMIITTAYLIFWAPLFLVSQSLCQVVSCKSQTCSLQRRISNIFSDVLQVTLINYTSDWKQAKNSMAHEVRKYHIMVMLYL